MPINESEWIWFDGEFVPWGEAKVHVLSHALHYGSSVFEGIRAYETPSGVAIFRLRPHVKRLYNSCKIARMPVPFTQEQLSEAIAETVRRNQLRSCYIRPLVFRGYEVLGVDPRRCPVHVIVAAFEWGTYLGAEALEQGVDVGVSTWRRMAPDTFPALAKIGGQYVNSQFLVMEARDRGFEEAIALDIYGYVSEGSGENLFVIQDGVIYTPPLGASILGGITRDSVIRIAHDLGYTVREQLIPRELLYIADEMFFTGTAAEITPIRSVDGQQIGEGRRGPITAKIQEQFFGIIQGKLPDRYGWLEYV
ncbi:MAG: branched-chain amino acid transaminase [Anaerolineae bacterium]